MVVSDYESLPIRIKQIYDDCKPEEQQYLIQILKELSEYGYSETYDNLWLEDFIEIPVDITTFVCDERYLGKTNNDGEAVYPYWKQCMQDIFKDFTKYQEVVFTGATRIGKTSTAVTCIAYMLYWLMCLRDPQAFFGKKEISKFSIHFFNVTKELASGVAYREANDLFRNSPWFCDHGTFSKSERNFYYIPDGGKVEIDYGSSYSDALGKQVFGAIMDECNFAHSGIKDINKAKEHMQELYDVVTARIEGTFRLRGKVYGKMFAVSSKKTDSDFLENHIQEQLDAGNEHLYVADKPQWEVLPPSMFSSDKFYIAVGDRHKKGFVVQDESEESLAELKELGYTLMQVPIDMKTNFVADFDVSLRDLAGISVPGALSFITQDSITTCLGTRRNPFTMDVLEVGTKDNYTIEEFFHEDYIDPRLKHMPLYIHLDLSITTDKTGLCGTVISGRKDMEDDDGKTVSMPTYSQLFIVAIQAPRNDKVPFAKITSFIVWLRKQGFNIQGISKDTFQSEYVGQLLEAQGFDVTNISLDRTPDGYMALRSIILEQRIDLLDEELYQNELIHLQRDGLSGKIDHPVGGCFTADTEIAIVDYIYNINHKNISDESLPSYMTIQQLLDDGWEGHYVFTVNEKTGECEVKPIKKVFKTKRSKVIEVTVKVVIDDKTVFTYKVKCTPEHRFMMSDGDFIEAYRSKGVKLKTINTMGLDKEITTINYSTVTDIQYLDDECDVYDLEIEDNHNFMLAEGLFVHNSKDSSDALAGSVWNATMNNGSVPVNRKKVADAIASVNTGYNGQINSADDLSNIFGPLYRNNKRK